MNHREPGGPSSAMANEQNTDNSKKKIKRKFKKKNKKK
jgi:hypothetical protein